MKQMTTLTALLSVGAWGQTAVQRQQVPGQFYNVTTSVSSTPYSVTSTESYVACDATSGTIVLTLPAATGTGREITFKKIDASANACTPTRAGSDTIDGATTVSMTVQYATVKLVDRASGAWSRSHVNQLAGDVTGISTNNSVAFPSVSVLPPAIAATAGRIYRMTAATTAGACLTAGDSGGTGIATCLATGAAYLAIPQTVARGSGLAIGGNAITAGKCYGDSGEHAVVTASAPGVLTTDVISFGSSGVLSASSTGLYPASGGGVTVVAYPTADNVNFQVCNWTSSPVTPSISVNWRVGR